VVPSFSARAVHHSEAERFIRKAMGTVGSSSLDSPYGREVSPFS
jgi:hypothetical protein